MDKDEMQGKAKEVAGRTEFEAGKATNNKKAQVRGALRIAEGKAQKMISKAKGAIKSKKAA
jgi:uncharacterized protein YjbJ (UPF0337 family)